LATNLFPLYVVVYDLGHAEGQPLHVVVDSPVKDMRSGFMVNV